MRSINEWDRTDLQALIDGGIPESLTLEYKRSEALSRSSNHRNELSKDISGLANSAGGLIVYGIVEDRHIPLEIDEGVDLGAVNREWIEQTLNSTIQPKVQGLLIQQIDLAVGRAAFVIEVPQARSLGPHQALDHKYYKRGNFMSQPMEDYEVRDVLRRASSPELFVEFETTNLNVEPSGTRFQICAFVHNRSTEPALYGFVSVLFDERLPIDKVDLSSSFSGGAPQKITKCAPIGSGGSVLLNGYTSKIIVPHTMPVFKESHLMLARFEIVLPPSFVEYAIAYEASCPGFNGHALGSLQRVVDVLRIEFN